MPGCDAHCKRTNSTQRKMFLPPAKLFQAWSDILPNKRKLKPHDRVCERHFEESDIIQFWESTINGQIHQTPRGERSAAKFPSYFVCLNVYHAFADKPRLRDNAIPSRNLPPKSEEDSVEDLKQIPKIEIISQKTIVAAKRKLREKPSDIQPRKLKRTKTVILTPVEIIEEKEDTNLVNKFQEPVIEVVEAAENVVQDLDDEQRLQMTAAFENLYDEAFDVTLPSLLWGIHRDPDRKFIAFSEYNQSQMSCCKVLHITSDFRCKISINSRLNAPKILSLAQLEAESVSTMLEEIDKEPLS